jgi:hypothetical protein
MGRGGEGRCGLGWQFRALKQDGYRHAVSLETHWRGAGSTEQSTRLCWAAMKRDLEKLAHSPPYSLRCQLHPAVLLEERNARAK